MNDELFTIRTANECLNAAKALPMPKRLFGEFWFEGELALMFGDAGSGTTSLGMQIAESIARGRAIGPQTLEARPQKVLYLDFELSGKQFEMRYTKDHESGESLKSHYRFSDKLYRVEIDTACRLPDGFRSFEEYLPGVINHLADQTGARVVIIDNITNLKRSYGSRECVELMRSLCRLKRELGISILVLARSERGSDTMRPVSTADLCGARLLCNVADNVFALGKSGRGRDIRYIKHLQPRSTEIIHDASHVPVFRLGKANKNFLGFDHLGFAPESDHLQTVHETRDWKTINEIKHLSDLGMTIRHIAEHLGLSKSTVHRMLQMWQPPPVTVQETVPAKPPFDPTTKWDYFPGVEEYDNALADDRFNDMFEPENYRLSQEYSLIELARHRAHQTFKKTGTAPTLHEDPNYAEFRNPTQPNDYEPQPLLSESANRPEPHESEPPHSDTFTTHHLPLTTSIDAYGREILVESADPTGRPMIWYQPNSKGQNTKYRRSTFGIIQEPISEQQLLSPVNLANQSPEYFYQN